MGEAQLSTIVGDPAIGVTDGPFNAKQQQKGRTTPKARGLGESYADGGAAGQSACLVASARARAASTAASSLALLAPPWVFTMTRIRPMKNTAMTTGGTSAET